MKRRRNRNDQRGFTFIELLLVIFVLAAAGTGILGSFLSTHLLTQYGRDMMVAMEDLKDMMEHIHATPFTDLLTDFPAGDADGPAGNGYTLPDQQITVTYPDPQTVSRREILVTLSWTSRGRARSAALSTVRTSI
jgi:prepilin-type N-terminal cleavage/methylation domain-containing protein